ncbi:1-phosphofructokinase [Oceanobacillus piezotolerans]|uniref:Tagatose-6-phosphate kinase n=1 Tax=Oceanobacillus piezotolerans TaxID=2448030 RepID=A0A498DL02_9BACI|nr:1-phosphofructokinase [Oceanobacillus piezotolerans]RLL43659.1 1-phosphofructokinase [Oceanobacillus piezotolerans]
MIYTVTLNPSIDYVVQVKDFELGTLNKMESDRKLPGGKGINVSRILHELEVDATALGFLGGFTGTFISDWLNNDNITTDFTVIEDDTRINIKLKSNEETELNGRGPHINEEEATRLLNQLSNLTEDDLVIFSGSKPPSLPADYYQQLIGKTVKANAAFVIDTTGQDLKNALAYHPFLVKPNQHELEELFGVKLNGEADIIPYGEKLLELGAQNVIVSLAGEGALLFTKEGSYRGISPKGTVKNSVGAGDSMIAGFIGEFSKTNDIKKAFQMGLTAGSATAFSEDLAKRADMETIYQQAEVRKI